MKSLFTTLVVMAIIFSCKKKDSGPPPTAPLVKTAALTNVTSISATAGGSIVSDGGATVTASGIVWSRAHATPSLTDSVVAATATSGAFTVNISGIDFNNTYYFRAFATNSIGTAYGDVVTLTTSNDSVRFTYNGQTVTYGIITSPTTGKKWLDRNIGAKRQAIASDDYQAYGDLFQWGRPADGHQLINWTSSTVGTPVNGMTGTKATSDTPGHSGFIILTNPSDPNSDWRVDNNRNRWNTTPQGPCPDGWHVPTNDEWAAEVKKVDLGNGYTNGGTAISGGISTIADAYNLLKLTAAGYRESFDPAGALRHPSERCDYWGSSDFLGQDGISVGNSVLFDDTDGDEYAEAWFKAYGYSIRCIKDL